jgi:hypothetical protein
VRLGELVEDHQLMALRAEEALTADPAADLGLELGGQRPRVRDDLRHGLSFLAGQRSARVHIVFGLTE